MRTRDHRRSIGALAVGALLAAACAGPAGERPPVQQGETIVAGYLERYFDTFPTRATAAGRHDLDGKLEILDERGRREWLAFNREVVARITESLSPPAAVGESLRLDLELLDRQARRQILLFEEDDAARHDPLFWTGMLGNATVFLLVRDDLPEAERLASAAERASQLPRLAVTARQALESGDLARIDPEIARMAAAQAAASARFYREGFAGAASEQALARRMAEAGAAAAVALEELAGSLEGLARRASGSFRLGDRYAARFRVITGIEEPLAGLLASVETALAAKRREAAEFGRAVWGRWMRGPAPVDDGELLGLLFARVAEDRPATVEELVTDYRRLIDESVRFVRDRRIVTLPEPFALWVGRSPAYFIGQSVGGVYPAGPYAAPEAQTLLFLPTPSDDADVLRRDAFFRDFNDHFNRMITPHEVIPGHYLQLRYAARHPSKVRALFGDGVYIEGWGTFCERLMLDLGWGDDLDRLAHLKKQLENIARTLVDIGVHTRGWRRQRVLELVQGEALQDEQFAGNMWRRTMTSSPQLTFYFLGYREVRGLYDAVRAAEGDRFDLERFTDGMMADGPVPVRHYRQRMLGAQGAAGS